jgi:hypothetical protein
MFCGNHEEGLGHPLVPRSTRKISHERRQRPRARYHRRKATCTPWPAFIATKHCGVWIGNPGFPNSSSAQQHHTQLARPLETQQNAKRAI